MKRPTDTPSEVMRFFTPELYLRFNSDDDRLADQADQAWEHALQQYRSHLESIRPRMPADVRRITELPLHDAELLGLEQSACWTPMAILSLKEDRSLRSVIYKLWGDVQQHPARTDWPFSSARIHCLYDEVDVTAGQDGRFEHRILLSDGRIVQIPFTSVTFSTVKLPEHDERDTRRIA